MIPLRSVKSPETYTISSPVATSQDLEEFQEKVSQNNSTLSRDKSGLGREKSGERASQNRSSLRDNSPPV